MTTPRCCTRCKKTFPAHMFGKDISRKDGVNPRCKPCNREYVKGLAQYVKTERDPLLVPPLQTSVMAGVYVPERGTYYRNDGLKHIKSIGIEST